MSGISILTTVNCDNKAKGQVMELFKRPLRQMFRDKASRFLFLAMRSTYFRVKMTTDKAYDLFMDFLNSVDPDIPDGADFVDFVGEMFQATNLAQMMLEIPALNNLVNWLKEEGICNVQAGILVKSGAAHVNVFTEGVKELFEKVMEGFQQ